MRLRLPFLPAVLAAALAPLAAFAQAEAPKGLRRATRSRPKPTS
jgi:hypothetical protein